MPCTIPAVSASLMVGSSVVVDGGSFRRGFLAMKNSNPRLSHELWLVDASLIDVWAARMTSTFSQLCLVATATILWSMMAIVANAVDSESSSLLAGGGLSHETWNGCSCCIWESNLVIVWKARIFLGISFGGEVGRGMPSGVSGDGSLFFSISLRGISLFWKRFEALWMRLKFLAMWKQKAKSSKTEDTINTDNNWLINRMVL